MDNVLLCTRHTRRRTSWHLKWRCAFKAAMRVNTDKTLCALKRGQLGCLKSKPSLVRPAVFCYRNHVQRFKSCLCAVVQLRWAGPCWKRTVETYGLRSPSHEELLPVLRGQRLLDRIHKSAIIETNINRILLLFFSWNSFAKEFCPLKIGYIQIILCTEN